MIKDYICYGDLPWPVKPSLVKLPLTPLWRGKDNYAYWYFDLMHYMEWR